MDSKERGCTACGKPGMRIAPRHGRVDWAGVLAYIHKGEPLCESCLGHLIQNANTSSTRRRSTIRWAKDGSPEVVTKEVKHTEFVDIKLRIPHDLKAEIQAKARAEGLSLNAWAGVVLHAAAHGLPFAFEKNTSGE
jgi:hypothetical protein